MASTGCPAAGGARTTATAVASVARLRRARAGRRVFAAAVTAFVLAGLLTAFGERVERVVDEAGGHTLTVEYPVRTRGGLSQDLDVTVTRAGGFDEPVTVAVSLEYLRLFEQQDIQPPPSSATATGERVEWTFAPPDGDTMRVIVDLRVEPHRHRGGAGVLEVLEGGQRVVSVRLETAVMP